MTPPHIHGSRRTFAVSKAVETIADTLTTIRKEDGLTWADVGNALGKSDDRARDYATGASEMPIGAFLLGCKEWNGRFANPVFGLLQMFLEDQSEIRTTDRDKLCRVTKLAHLMTVAMTDEVTPGSVDDTELTEIPADDLVAAEAAIRALRIRRERLTGASAPLSVIA